ncbi:type II toxin-antitoxin system RelB/DinJ family antitoxin [Sphingomonas hankookensis]|uniref:type II toxin-antitoxin system RelB/DinJ family antitoxin n=1 Tax=Sphingomonas hankookensis TaxID=563996 RepID=UPI001F55AAED|nr:type II toxin-antitoxin system RelB/DinJ family antitoxin [Sphingomonas hankookensis]
MISIPVDPVLETEVAEVLNRTGLTNEAAVRMLFVHLAKHGSMPTGLIPMRVVPSFANVATDTMMRTGRNREDR